MASVLNPYPVAGQQLTALTRRALDLAGEGAVIDPAPLLLILANLVQHNKGNSRVGHLNFLIFTRLTLIRRKCWCASIRFSEGCYID